MKQNGLYIAVAGIIIVALLLIFGASYDPGRSDQATPAPTVTATKTDQPIVIDENWSEYISSEVGFSIEYPEGMDVNEPPIGGVNFTYLGPTQTENTEIFDGITMTITRESLRNRYENTRALAESTAEDSRVHGEIVEELEPVTINGIDGYAFTLEGLGTIRHIILEHSPETVLSITYIAPDPEDEGYMEVVDRILGSLEVL